jgi:hypothetical protein
VGISRLDNITYNARPSGDKISSGSG